MTYTLAVKMKECPDEEKKFCMTYLRYGKCCNNSSIIRDGCKKLIELNPICFSDGNSCNDITILSIKDESYVLYRCDKRCRHYIKCDVDKLLKDIERDDLYYGEKLSKLLKKIEKTSAKKSTQSIPEDIMFIKVLLDNIKDMG